MKYKKIVCQNTCKKGNVICVNTYDLADNFLEMLYEQNKICGDISISSVAKSLNKNLVKEINKKKIADTLIRSYKKYYVNDKELNIMIRNEVDELIEEFLEAIRNL